MSVEHNDRQALESALYIAFHTTPAYKPITISTSDYVWNTLSSLHLSIGEDFPTLSMAYAATYVSRLSEQEGYDLSCLFRPLSTHPYRTLCVVDGFINDVTKSQKEEEDVNLQVYYKTCTHALQCYVACISFAASIVCCQGTHISFVWMLNSLGISIPIRPIDFQMQVWRDLEFRLITLSSFNFNPDLKEQQDEEEEIEEGQIVGSFFQDVVRTKGDVVHTKRRRFCCCARI